MTIHARSSLSSNTGFARLRLGGCGLLLALAAACTNSTSGAGAPASSSSSGGPTDGTTNGGDGTTPGQKADGGGVVSGGEPLPPTTFLYRKAITNDVHHLIAYDIATGAERTVTDLRGDGSEGWEIAGFAVSPDRTKIAIASLYGPTSQDNLYGNSARRIWTLNTDGTGFLRLTPVFKTLGKRVDVRTPTFSADGKTVYYGYGEASANGSGVTRTWSVAADGSSLPDLLDIPASCSTGSVPSVDPATGKVMIIQETCASSTDEGFFFFTADNQATEPVLAFGDLDTRFDQARWTPDGSLFVFAARQSNVASLYAYVPAQKKLAIIVQGTDALAVEAGAVSPDGNYVVYCATEGGGTNIHVLDLTKEPAVDTPVTKDGISCHPAF